MSYKYKVILVISFLAILGLLFSLVGGPKEISLPWYGIGLGLLLASVLVAGTTSYVKNWNVGRAAYISHEVLPPFMKVGDIFRVVHTENQAYNECWAVLRKRPSSRTHVSENSRTYLVFSGENEFRLPENFRITHRTDIIAPGETFSRFIFESVP